MNEWDIEESTAFTVDEGDIDAIDVDDVVEVSEFELELVDVEPVALELAVWEPTGESRVDAALDRLHDLDGLPTVDHVEVYEDVHRRLQEALADLEPSA